MTPDTFSYKGIVFFCHHFMPAKIKVDPKFAFISDEGRAEMNEWLRDMFGPTDEIMLFKQDRTAFCAPHIWKEIKRAAVASDKWRREAYEPRRF